VSPPAGELALTLVAVLVALLGHNYGRPINETTNIVVPVILIMAQGFAIASLISRSFLSIWTPLIWTRIAFIFYFGVGSLVPGFVNDVTLQHIEGFYYFFAEDVAKYSLVNAIFALTMIATTRVIIAFYSSENSASQMKIDPSAFDRRVLGLFLIGLGTVVYFGLSFPALLGVEGATSTVLVSQLANSAHIGIFLLASWSIANRSQWIYFAIATTVLFFLAGLITLAKYEALLPVLMLALAYVYERRSFRTAITAGVAVYAVFLAISGPVGYARQEAGSAGSAGGFGSASIVARAEIYLTYGSRDVTVTDEDFQQGWARLSYVNAGTFAINQFDAGISGNSFEYLPIVWLPRFIYPSKPPLTEKARDFNVAISGSDSSSSGPGMPSEGYWNYGWLGVVGLASLASFILTIWSIYTVSALQVGAWHLLLVILLGLRVGTRVDGWLVTDIVGPVGYAIIGHIGLTFINRLILRRKQHRQRSAATARG
jgi:hypothetical protein